jgi:hypothetical protein
MLDSLETKFDKELYELESSLFTELAKTSSLPYPPSAAAAVHQPHHGQMDTAKSKGKLPLEEGT